MALRAAGTEQAIDAECLSYANMKIALYQVDAFARQAFGGNPAAVCPLANWLDDALLQAIAAENNLSETAFLVRTETDHYALRWFTPVAEVDLCGHATLASAHVLFRHLGLASPVVHFDTRSGRLSVEQHGDMLRMDFPAQPSPPVPAPAALTDILGRPAELVLGGQDLIVVLPDEHSVRILQPDPVMLRGLPGRGIAFTAPGTDCDFVSRAFYPKLAIAEDPVTGSVHCQLIPYWAARLGKTRLAARQLSQRGGQLDCTLAGPRVYIGGHAFTFMTGNIHLPD